LLNKIVCFVFMCHIVPICHFSIDLGGVQVLRREKIKVEYQTSHLSKIVGTLSPPTDFSLAVPSPHGVIIIRSNIEYCAALMPNTSSAAYPFSLVLDCRRDRRLPLLSTSLSSRRLLSPSAPCRRPLIVIARRCPPPGEHSMRRRRQRRRRWR
jgi:hypothetical protein